MYKPYEHWCERKSISYGFAIKETWAADSEPPTRYILGNFTKALQHLTIEIIITVTINNNIFKTIY